MRVLAVSQEPLLPIIKSTQKHSTYLETNTRAVSVVQLVPGGVSHTLVSHL